MVNKKIIAGLSALTLSTLFAVGAQNTSVKAADTNAGPGTASVNLSANTTA